MFASAFRVSLLGCVLGLLATCGTSAADDKKPSDEKKIELSVGDKAPKFEARTDRDTTWSSADSVGKKWVVVYFYPGDFTPGCTSQAKAFRDSMKKLTDQGVEVIGISGDAVKTHELFRQAQKLNFTLLADEEGTIAKAFGVPVGKGATVKARDAANKLLEVDGKPYEFERKTTAARWTFVIDKSGKVAYKNTKVVAAEGAKEIAEFIEKANEK
jgi:thioredoxin-dependent peroxiredoxin